MKNKCETFDTKLFPHEFFVVNAKKFTKEQAIAEAQKELNYHDDFLIEKANCALYAYPIRWVLCSRWEKGSFPVWVLRKKEWIKFYQNTGG